MARRNSPPLYGKRYCGNKSNKEVHDLDNEDFRPFACQINEIINAGNARIFDPDTLEQAHKEGYYNCHYCIEESEK
jgi:hypothetical protein